MSTVLASLPPDFNATLFNHPELCTLQTCPLVLAYVDYIPSLADNVLFTVFFGLALIAQGFLTIKYGSAWDYGIAMFGGLVLEILGHAARIQMHYNPFTKNPFLTYLVCLTLGPAFLSAAVYLCLSRLVVIYSESVSWLRPASYALIFIDSNFLSLLVQAIGDAIASSASTAPMTNIGKDIMAAGVAWQVVSLALFATLFLEFAQRVQKVSEIEMNPAFAPSQASRKFKLFQCSLAISTLTIFVRSVFRCAELSGRFRGPLANQQVTFKTLEGAMICIAVICLTLFHPGLVFGEHWQTTPRNIRSKPKFMEKLTDDIVKL